jgi:glycosyltransferase involved in cell wall biosynthesis
VSAPSASVVLLTRNAMPQLAELWQRLAAQEVDGGFEVVAVDSESDDGTAEFLAARADRLIRIPRERFNHGATRNLGIEAARAERVAFLVQDALPASPRWLAELAAPLADECVAGAFSRQIPAHGASALARHQLAGWVTTSERPRRVRLAPEVFASLPPLETAARVRLRQRELVSPAGGMAAPPVPRHADRGGHRGGGSACCWPATRSPTRRTRR